MSIFHPSQIIASKNIITIIFIIYREALAR